MATSCREEQVGGGGTGCDGVTAWKLLGPSGEEGSGRLLWDADGGGGEGYREQA